MATPPNSAVSSSCLKHAIFLHEWWLIKVDLDGCSKRLGVGGFTSRGSQDIRCFSSAPIVKRCDAVTLTSADGMTVMFHGLINRSRTLDNGFANEVCDHFVIGFPYYWEEFAVVPVDEEDPEPPHSPPISDGNKMPNMKIVDDIKGITEGSAPSTTKNKSFQGKLNLEDVESTRRVTRSRARSQTNIRLIGSTYEKSITNDISLPQSYNKGHGNNLSFGGYEDESVVEALSRPVTRIFNSSITCGNVKHALNSGEQKQKWGRPGKYGPDGSMSVAMVGAQSQNFSAHAGTQQAPVSGSLSPTGKKRGRPPGSSYKKKQLMP